VLVSAREGTVAHERSLERLPQTLADLQFSFLVLYPSEKDARSFSTFQPQKLPDILNKEHVLFGLDTPSYEKTVDALLSTAIDHNDPRHSAVLKALVYDEVGYASEILPGVIISHARVQELKQAKMLLGIHQHGVPHERVARPIHVVVLLLSPAERTTQDHLAQLAEVAQYFSHIENLDQLMTCNTIDQLQSWFNQQGKVYPSLEPSPG